MLSLKVARVDSGMGTKIQANPFLQEKHHSVIDLDASTSNAMRSSYNEIGMLQNGKNPEAISSYDIQKVKQTILEHESVFRNQVLIILILNLWNV